jgi:hypothetical protein
MRGEPAEIAARIEERLIPYKECLLWIGPPHPRTGYGQVTVNGVHTQPHRALWIAKNGPAPEGLEPDHTCRRKLCCNLDHLEWVTHRENCRRRVMVLPTHCPQGHPYDEANTYRRPNQPTWRYCRTCVREANRARRRAATV